MKCVLLIYSSPKLVCKRRCQSSILQRVSQRKTSDIDRVSRSVDILIDIREEGFKRKNRWIIALVPACMV